MKTWIVERDAGNHETIVGSNKFQEIKYDKEGNPYVRYRNQRLMLDEFMSVNKLFSNIEKVMNMEIHGALSTTYFSCYLIHISSDGEEAKVFYSYC